MGDMREAFDSLKEYNKNRRSKNADKANDLIASVLSIPGVKLVQNRKHTWHLTFHGSTLMYYPPSGKWQYMNRYYNGGIDSFINWLRKRSK